MADYYGAQIPMLNFKTPLLGTRYWFAVWYGPIGNDSCGCPVPQHTAYGSGLSVLAWLWRHVGFGIHTSGIRRDGSGNEFWWQSVFPFYGVRRLLVMLYWRPTGSPQFKKAW